MPKTEPQLTESEVAEIERRANLILPDDSEVFLLIRDLRALRAENGDLHSELLEFKKNREASDLGYIRQIETYAKANERVAAENAALRQQLAETVTERDKLLSTMNVALPEKP